MIKKIASVLLGAVLAPQPVSAQVDRTVAGESDVWIIYERTATSGLPLVIMTRTGNSVVGSLLRNGLATVVNCKGDPASVNDRGMPQGTDSLYAIEDQLAAAPVLLTSGGLQVASVTGDGQRRMFYLHPSPIDFSPLMQQVSVHGFSCSASSYTIDQSFIDLITPTNLERQLNGDQAVIASLQKNGDDGHLPRKTDFWFYGQKAALKSLVVDLEAHGFVFDHWLDDPAGVVLSRKMSVDFATFQATTPMLLDSAEMSGVEYDGWETEVIRPDSTQAPGGAAR